MTDRQLHRIVIGNFVIEDLLNPKPEELDLEAIQERLKNIRRWGNNPKALTVSTHQKLVERLLLHFYAPRVTEAQRFWARHHDDVEAITGDIVSPVKAAIASESDILERIELGLERALYAAYGRELPSQEDRNIVHRYDLMAAAAEWLFLFGKPWAGWIPSDLRFHDLLEMQSILYSVMEEEREHYEEVKRPVLQHDTRTGSSFFYYGGPDVDYIPSETSKDLRPRKYGVFFSTGTFYYDKMTDNFPRSLVLL